MIKFQLRGCFINVILDFLTKKKSTLPQYMAMIRSPFRRLISA